jgi:glycosyltransferase involved in cell wall biosynthesis
VQGAEHSQRRLLFLLKQLPNIDLAIALHVGVAPLVWWFHKLRKIRSWGVVLYGFESWERWPLLKRKAVAEASFVVSVSRYTAELAFERNGAPQGFVLQIPPVSSLEGIESGEEPVLDGAFRILSVSRLDPSQRYKGLDPLLEAVARLEGSPSAFLHVVGSGGDRSRLEAKAAQLGIAARTRFWGELAPEALARAYQQAQVFALPSAREGFGIVYLEAMLHGVPVVGAAAGAVPELIWPGENGFLVPPGDVAALRATLERLRKDPALATTLGQKGRALAIERFGPARFESSWLTLVEKILTGSAIGSTQDACA